MGADVNVFVMLDRGVNVGLREAIYGIAYEAGRGKRGASTN
nr:hypothetical protein [Candidatus Freyrarchaeum guaymaensis]